jgi:hypothetical protein
MDSMNFRRAQPSDDAISPLSYFRWLIITHVLIFPLFRELGASSIDLSHQGGILRLAGHFPREEVGRHF